MASPVVIGGCVCFTDAANNHHDALVVEIFGDSAGGYPVLNLVTVVDETLHGIGVVQTHALVAHWEDESRKSVRLQQSWGRKTKS